jgi:hypothetical protein
MFLGKLQPQPSACVEGPLKGYRLDSITLFPAYDMSIQMIPIPLGPNKVGMQREISAGPIGIGLEPAPLHLAAVGIQFFEDMKPSDLARYKSLVDQARNLCIRARAQNAGLEISSPKGG